MKPLAIHAYTATTALGAGREALWRALREQRSGLEPCDFEDADLATWIGRVPGCEDVALPAPLADWMCRNNQLAELTLQQDGFLDAVKQALTRHAPERIGLFLGTSTSGIRSTERAYREVVDGRLPDWFSFEHTHDYFALCGYVQRRLGLAGPALTISTACSSSAKVFASAARSIAAGFCDVAVVGGVDSLCLTTLYGFASLQLTSPEPCRPWDAQRSGISIGEAGGFANRAMPTTWRPPSRTVAARRWPCVARSPARAWPPTRWITSTCMAPRRRPTIRPRTARWSMCSGSRPRRLPPRAGPGIRWARPASWKPSSPAWRSSMIIVPLPSIPARWTPIWAVVF